MMRSKIKELLEKGALYGITDAHYSPQGNVAAVCQMLQSGIRIIQYRAKNFAPDTMLEELRELRRLTKQAGALLIVNDHPDLCLQVQADGIHVGQDDLPVAEVRKLLGEGIIIGLSTHNREQGQQALQTSADYVGVGPVFPTATKPHEPVVGLEFAGYVARKLDIAHVAIGGINEKNLPQVLEQGIKSVCMVGDLLQSPDMPAKIQRVQNLLLERCQP